MRVKDDLTSVVKHVIILVMSLVDKHRSATSKIAEYLGKMRTNEN